MLSQNVWVKYTTLPLLLASSFVVEQASYLVEQKKLELECNLIGLIENILRLIEIDYHNFSSGHYNWLECHCRKCFCGEFGDFVRDGRPQEEERSVDLLWNDQGWIITIEWNNWSNFAQRAKFNKYL